MYQKGMFIASALVADILGHPRRLTDPVELRRRNMVTPAEMIARLQQEVAFALRQPDVAERAASLGLDLLGTRPEQFAAFQRAEIVKWGKVIRSANIQVD